eukprot:gene3344-6016_t
MGNEFAFVIKEHELSLKKSDDDDDDDDDLFTKREDPEEEIMGATTSPNYCYTCSLRRYQLQKTDYSRITTSSV